MPPADDIETQEDWLAEGITLDEVRELFPEYEIDHLDRRESESLVYQANAEGKAILLTLCLFDSALDKILAQLERASQLSHSNIATMLEYGERGGFVYVAMEAVPGACLADLIQRNAIDSSKAIRYVRDICEIVEYAESSGVNLEVRAEGIVISHQNVAKLQDLGAHRLPRGEEEEAPAAKSTVSREHSSLSLLVQTLLTGSARDDAGARKKASTDEATLATLNDVVPGYQILRKLGEGGFGIVYLAKQTHPVRRQVALKILKPGMDGREVFSRFEAERQALAMLDDPRIATIFDAGETEKGRPFFAMELADGLPITEYCEAHQLDCRERLVLFKEVGEGLQHAHQRGIIHRDLKPSNILVEPVDENTSPANAKVKVIDFGIAKATEAFLTDQPLHTRAAQILGTPNYMSPEQACIDRRATDTRSDIYSLGCILYELLTGTTPVDRDEIDTTPLDDVLKQIRERDPLKPSDRLSQQAEPTAIRAGDLRGDLDWIVMKALRKEPSQRYGSVSEFADDVQRYLENEAVLARPPSLTYVTGKFYRRNKAFTLAALAGLGVLIAGTIVSSILYFLADKQARLTEESEARGRRLFSRADFTHATSLLKENQPSLAVAHLARALRTRPDKSSAATRLLDTLASHHWAIPAYTIPHHGRVAYSPDGSKILFSRNARPGSDHLWDPYLRVFDSSTGTLLHELKLDSDHEDFVIGPDGKTIAVSTGLGQVMLWDLPSGKLIRKMEQQPIVDAKDVRISPDNRYVACSYWRESIARIWDIDSGQMVSECRLPDQDTLYSSIVFDDDRRHLLFAHGRYMRVFEIESGRPVSPMMQHDGTIKGVSDYPTADRLLSWSSDKTVKLWHTKTGEAEWILTHERPVNDATISPDGTRLLTGTAERPYLPGVARLWDLTTQTMIGEPISRPGGVSRVIFSADGTKCAVASAISELGDSAVLLLDAWTAEPLTSIYHPRGAQITAIHPSGNQLIISSRHDEAAVWEIKPRAQQPIHIRTKEILWRVNFDGDSDSVLTTAYGGLTQRWNSKTGEPLSDPEAYGPNKVAGLSGIPHSLRNGLHHHFYYEDRYLQSMLGRTYIEGEPVAAAVSDDGETLVTGCKDGALRVWSTMTGTQVRDPIDDLRAPVTALALDRRTTVVAVGYEDGSVELRDFETGQSRGLQAMHESEVSTLSWSPDDHTLASGSIDGMARLWRLTKQPSLSPLLPNEKKVTHLAFSANGKILASGGRSNAAFLWEVETGRQLGEPLRHIDSNSAGLMLSWVNSGKLVTTGSHDDTARVWDPRTSQMLTKPLKHGSMCYAFALRPDASACLMGSRSARVWDLEEGQPLTSFLPHGSDVRSAAFDSTGQRFVTGTWYDGAYVRDLVIPSDPLPNEFVDFAEALGGFRFTEAGVLEQVPAGLLEQSRRHILALEPDSPEIRWMQWLAADPDTRTNSPFSDLTITQYVSQLVKEGSRKSLHEALRHRPHDAGIMAAYAVALATPDHANVSSRQFGKFLAERARKMAPDDLEVQLAYATILAAMGEDRRALLALAPTLLARPEDPLCWHACAGFLEKVGWHVRAVAAYREASKLFGQDVEQSRACDEAINRIRSAYPANKQAIIDDALKTYPNKRSRFLSVLRALTSDNPREAMIEVAAGPRNWTMHGEVALLIAERIGEEGERALANRYRDAGVAALLCSNPLPERREMLSQWLGDDHEEALPLITSDADWAYLDGDPARRPPKDWEQPEFNDSYWSTGLAPLGYGNGNEATILSFGQSASNKPMMACFRINFDWPIHDSQSPPRLRVKFRCDDGMVLHLNGQEWWRYNMPARGSLTSTTPASSIIDREKETRLVEEVLEIPSPLSKKNVLAVSVHQSGRSSSDLALELALFHDTPLAQSLMGRTTVEEIATTLKLTTQERELMRVLLENEQH